MCAEQWRLQQTCSLWVHGSGSEELQLPQRLRGRWLRMPGKHPQCESYDLWSPTDLPLSHPPSPPSQEVVSSVCLPYRNCSNSQRTPSSVECYLWVILKFLLCKTLMVCWKLKCDPTHDTRHNSWPIRAPAALWVGLHFQVTHCLHMTKSRKWKL